MKSKLFLFLTLLSLLFVTACKDTKPTAEVTDTGLPVFEFTSGDSTEIMQLANDYMARFSAKDFRGASDMLYTVHDNTIVPLTDDQRNGYEQAMNALPIFASAVKELKLFSDRDNELRIAVQVAEDGDLESEMGTINFVLNPVEVEGKWYLTLRDEYAEGVGLYHQN